MEGRGLAGAGGQQVRTTQELGGHTGWGAGEAWTQGGLQVQRPGPFCPSPGSRPGTTARTAARLSWLLPKPPALRIHPPLQGLQALQLPCEALLGDGGISMEGRCGQTQTTQHNGKALVRRETPEGRQDKRAQQEPLWSLLEFLLYFEV